MTRFKFEVSIIIVNYKTPQLCINCINSIEKNSKGFSYEILIIDNNSSDDSIEKLNSSFKKNIQIIESPTNLGTAKAYNLGIEKSDGQFIMLLNSDTVLINNAIYIMLCEIKKDPKIGAVGCNLYDYDMKPTHSYMRYYGMNYFWWHSTLFGTAVYRFLCKTNSLEFNYGKKCKKINYSCAAATLFKKESLTKAGLFDKDIFMYGEEPLLAQNMRNNGCITISTPTAKIQHLEGQSSVKESNGFKKSQYQRFLDGTSIYFKKTFGTKGKRKWLKLLIKGDKARIRFYKFIRNVRLVSNFSDKLALTKLMLEK